ncbi:MAG TPA: hypothetical protein VF454_06400, partial [Gemmatimonadales bacterium]
MILTRRVALVAARAATLSVAALAHLRPAEGPRVAAEAIRATVGGTTTLRSSRGLARARATDTIVVTVPVAVPTPSRLPVHARRAVGEAGTFRRDG